MRSALRWVARLGLGVVLLTLVIAAMLLATAHTGWGREQLRSRVEAALRETFPGGARVAALEGSLLGSLTLRGVEIDRPDGKPMVAIAQLRVDLALWPLANRTARVHALVADGVRISIAPAPAPAAASPASDAAPSPWRIELERVAIERASLEVAIGGTTIALTELSATAAGTVERGVLTLFAWSHARWPERDTEVTAAAAIVVDRSVRLPVAHVALRGATLGATDVAIDLGADGPRFPIERGALAITASGRALASLAPELRVPSAVADALGDIVAIADARPAGTADRSQGAGSPPEIRLEVHAGTAVGRAWASLRGDPLRETVRGVISVADIDLSSVTRGRWCGRGAAVAALDGAALDGPDARLRGTAIVDADVLGALRDLDRLRGEPAARCRGASVAERAAAPAAVVAFDATHDRARVAVLAGEADAPHAFAVGSVARRGGALVLDDVHAAVRANAVTAAGQRVEGLLAATGSATGSLAPALDVRVDGHAAGRQVATDDVAIDTAQGPFSLHVTSTKVLGTAQVTATGIRGGGVQVASIRAEVDNLSDGSVHVVASARPDASGLEVSTDARVAPHGAQIVAEIDHSGVVLPGGMVWDGRGGSLVIDPQSITMRDVTLRSGDGAVAIRGEVARATGALVAHLSATRLAELQIRDRYRGVASGTLDLAHRRGTWTARGQLELHGVALDAAHPGARLDLAADLALEGRRVIIDARATGAALGSAELAVEARAPRDPFDLHAWQALDRDAIGRAAFTARRLELSQLAALAAPPGSADLGERLHGTVDGTVQLASGELTGGLAVRDIAVPFAVLDGDLSFAGRGGDAGVRATARLSDLGSAEIAARFALPDRPFAPATWRRGGRDLLLEASAAVTGIAFDRERLDRLGVLRVLAAHGLDGDFRGQASVAVSLDAAAADLRLALDIEDLTGGGLVEPVSPHIAIAAGPSGTDLHASAVVAQGEAALSLGELEGDLAMTLDRWLEDPTAALRAPLRAAWTLPATPAANVLALVGRRDLAGGTIAAQATVGGTLSVPVVAARLGARDVAVATRVEGHPPAVLRDLDADVSWEDGMASLEVRGHADGNGELRASARGRLDTLAGATASLSVRHFDIAPLAVVATGAVPQLPAALVSASGTLDADLALASARVGGTLTLSGGSLPIGAAVGTLRDASARLVFDDRAIHATVRGRLGRGTIALTASAAGDLSSIDATLKLSQVSPIAALRPVIDADIDARLRLGDDRPCSPGTRAARLCGSISIARARIALPDHASTPLLDATAPDDLVFVGRGAPAGGARVPGAPTAAPPGSARPARETSARPWLVAAVTLDSTPIVAEDVAEGVSFHADVHSDQLALAIGDAVGVRGRVEIDHADADILGRRYAVEPSGLVFDGTAEPRIDIRMSHQFPELALDVAITGPASSPDLRLSGEPGGYTYDQLFGFFVGGEPGGDPGAQTRDAVAGAGARWVSGKLGRRIGKVLPVKIDAISCEPSPTASATAGGSCTFGKWLSERLFVAYRQHLGGASNENTGDVQVQLRVGRKVLMEASGGDRGHYGADLLYRHRW